MFKPRSLIPLACAAVAAPAVAETGTEPDEDARYVEEVIVTGERGEINVLDRPMTVTGFSQATIERLGMQNADDLEVLVPGLQVGNRSQGGGKNEDDHFYMRGIGSERTVNFFSDTSVAVYVDGVWTDQTYGTDGLFDVERVEVARGPQGTTGGRAAMAGSIHYHTRKPTDDFDMRVNTEFTDQFSQKWSIAFGGPIMDSDFSYRLAASLTTGDGEIENVANGPDAAVPDRRILAPSLRWKNDRWDVVARYSNQRDTGTPRASLPLGARNTTDEYILDAEGNPVCVTDEETGREVCQRNPFFGANVAPAVANCGNINNDGTRDEFNIICDPDDLQWKVAFNAPIAMDSAAENASIDVVFALTDTLELNYRFGWRDVINDTTNDGDQLPREGGGVCPFDHPKVVSGQLTAGQTSRYCAMDGGGNGTFDDNRINYIFQSEQVSHEMTFRSNMEGKFNFTAGITTLAGEEPYFYKDWDFSSDRNDWLYEDTSAACNAVIESLYGDGGSLSGGVSWLLRDVYTNPAAMARAGAGLNLYACPGSPEIVNYSHTGVEMFTANPSGHASSFFGSSEYSSSGAYFNGEFVLNDAWTVFGGVRHDLDKKDHTQDSFATTFAREAGDLDTQCTDHVCADGIAFVQISVRDSSIERYAGKADSEWSATTWNIGAQYRPREDMMYYARVSTGYRPGGFLGYGTSQAPWDFESEELTNYEVGLKGLFFDNRVQFSGTYFFQDFSSHWIYASRLKDEAEIALDPSGGPLTGEVTAIEGTTIQGLEIEGAWRLHERFTVRGFYNYLDTSIGTYPALYPFAVPGEPGGWNTIPYTDAEGNDQVAWIFGSPTPRQFGGRQLPNQPKHKYSLTFAWDAPIRADWGSLELLTIMNYRSKKFVEMLNLDAYAIDPYTRWDLRANWSSADSAWGVALYVQNALDQAALHMWSPREGAGQPWGTLVEPRRVGLQVTWQAR